MRYMRKRARYAFYALYLTEELLLTTEFCKLFSESCKIRRLLLIYLCIVK